MGSARRIEPCVLIVEGDAPLGASLTFALGLEGIKAASFRSGGELLNDSRLRTAECLIVEHRPPQADAVTLLNALRSAGSAAPAIVIASHPTRAQRAAIDAIGAVLIEKPLLGDALFAEVRAALCRKGAAA